MRRILYESVFLKVVSNHAGGDAVFVTFQSAAATGLDREGFGEGFFKKRGIPAICVLPHLPSWYQYDGILEALNLIRKEAAQYRRVIAYGISMGGYAAINFADLIGATEVIAICPQYTVNPSVVPWETRFPRGQARIKHYIYDQPQNRNWEGKDVCVIYDPVDSLDSRHVDLLKECVPATFVRLPHSTHPCTQVLSTASLKAFILSCLERGVLNSIPLLHASFKSDRKKSWYYWLYLARNYGLSSPKKALRFVEYADTISPRNPDVLFAIAMIRLSLGRFQDALIAFDASIKHGSDNAAAQSGRAQCFIGMRSKPRAARALAKAVSLGLSQPERDHLDGEVRGIGVGRLDWVYHLIWS